MITTHATSMTSAHYARMGEDECEKIHFASLEILERIGIDVHDEKANDILGFLRAATRGIEVNDETLALDVIEELGPTGSFLDHEHTMRHYREPFYSKLADKRQHSLWLEQGGTTMEARAAEIVDEILAKHQPESLPTEVQKAIKKIVKREQARINSIDPD